MSPFTPDAAPTAGTPVRPSGHAVPDPGRPGGTRRGTRRVILALLLAGALGVLAAAPAGAGVEPASAADPPDAGETVSPPAGPAPAADAAPSAGRTRPGGAGKTEPRVARAGTSRRRLGRLQAITPASPEDDRLGAEDLLDIRVVGVEDLSSTVRVTESGHITLPLIGQVQVAGLSSADLETALASRLEERYINNPQVSVFVKEHGSKSVSVIGAVEKPGRYTMLGRRTLLDIVSDAGGLTDERGPLALITRRAGGDTAPETLKVDLDALLIEGRVDLNTEIQPGDLVHIPLDLPVRIYVNGAVSRPGEYETRASRPLTLLQAITKAGGPDERAALKKVEILRRRPDGSQETLAVDVRQVMKGLQADPILLDGDVVVVPETYF